MRKTPLLLLICAALSIGCKKEPQIHHNGNQNQDTEVPTPDPQPSERPTDFEIGSRAVASWKVPESTYLKVLDMELLRDNPKQIDQELFKGLLKFQSSSVDGSKRYDFTEEDVKETAVEELDYNFQEGILSFKITYKGVTSKTVSMLEFSPQKYYSMRFPINQKYISQHYMRGIHEYIGQFVGSVLTIENERYLPGEIVSKGKDDHRNSMTFTFKVHDTIRNEEIIEITKDLNGFQTVKDLASAMKIIPTHELLEAARAAVGSVDKYPGKNLLQVLRLKFGSQRWMEKMQYVLDDTTLEFTGTVLSGSGNHLDVYLEDLRWYLKDANLQSNTLSLDILLEGVNGIVLSNVSYRLELKGI